MENVTETDAAVISDAELDKEITDVLIAISVITRQLAKKITGNHMSKEETANEEKRNGGTV